MSEKNIVILSGIALLAGIGVAFYQGIKNAYDHGFKEGSNKVLEAWKRQDQLTNESWRRFEEALKQPKTES